MRDFDRVPICPVCGEECSWVFVSDGDVVGCDNCVEQVEAWDWLNDEEENERCLREEARYEELREISGL